MTDASQTEIEVDAIGLLCPLPVLRLRKAMRKVTPGGVARLIATDPMAEIDVPHFCAEAGHVLLSKDDDGEQMIFRVQKKRG